MPQPKVIIIILNWNGLEDTLECAASVSAIDYPNFEAVVVDNGSTDGSVVVFKERLGCATVLETGRNLGYAGGNNVGIRHALKNGADYILLLNNDVVVDGAILRVLAREAESRPNGAIWGAKILSYNDPKAVLYAGSVEDRDRAAYGFLGGGTEDDAESDGEPVETAFVHGAAFMIRAAAIHRVGLMDERFFLYFEEAEWCSRMRENGYKLYYVPRARVWHKIAKSMGGTDSPLQKYFMARNHLLWAEMHSAVSARARLLLRLSRFVLFPLSEMRAADAVLNPRRLYWAFSTWLRRTFSQWRDPGHWAFVIGVRDYFMHRLGDCPPCVRRWNEQNRP